MNRTKFSIQIKASKQKVWDVLWDDETYKKWTSVFCEGSYADTDWKEGSKVLFLSPGGDGMYSTIYKKSPPDYMSFKHNGVVKNGIEQPLDAETSKWSGALENYTLQETGGITELTIDIDVADEMKDYFEDKFPKALEKVKILSEE